MRWARESHEGRMLLAANALLLARQAFLIELREYLPEVRKDYHDTDREDYSSFYRLRECFAGTGLLDRRIEPMFRNGGKGDESAIRTLLDSGDPISVFSFGDAPFSPAERDALEGVYGRRFSWQEWAMPICLWRPGKVIWTARNLVADFFIKKSAEDTRVTASAPLLEARSERGRLQSRIIDAIESVYERHHKRALRSDVVEVLETHLGSKAAAERAWDLAKIERWKKGGRPPDGSLMSRREFEEALNAALNLEP